MSMRDGTGKKHSREIQAIVARAAEYLCKESQYGSWGDARITAMCIGALSNCGLTKTHPGFMSYCARQMLHSEECIRDEAGLSLNLDAWDTAVALIALKASGVKELKPRISDFADWLLEEFSEDGDNMHQDPWDTLYAVYALQWSGLKRRPVRDLIKECLSWVLDKRNPEGVFISSHYVGLLLPVVSHLLTRGTLAPQTRTLYKRVVAESLDYLKKEFVRNAKQGRLWSNEAWGIGHIMLGIGSTSEGTPEFFEDMRFNKFLIKWCNSNWDASLGWTDHYETAIMLMGLSEYCITREVLIAGGGDGVRSEAQREIAESVQFNFREPESRPMTVYPVWRQTTFVPNRKSCCLLMPLSKPWSGEVKAVMRRVMHNLGFDLVLPDAQPDGEIMESIWRTINEARIIIADITTRNPNVMYEIGIAHTIGKDVILLAQDLEQEKIPFDIHSRRIIPYDLATAQRELAPRLRETIDSILTGAI